jgi:hypothetical protein
VACEPPPLVVGGGRRPLLWAGVARKENHILIKPKKEKEKEKKSSRFMKIV